MTNIHTLGELRNSGYKIRSVKDEMRENLLAKIARREKIFAGIHGYERTVMPALHNAILSKHDIILLGLRGQAKTRILRSLTGLLGPRSISMRRATRATASSTAAATSGNTAARASTCRLRRSCGPNTEPIPSTTPRSTTDRKSVV